MSGLDETRRRYAEEIRAESKIKSEALVEAFARVHREHFLGPGPWKVVWPEAGGDQGYQITEATPAQLYQNVLVAIDAARGLNNGLPSSLALWLDALELRPGDRVYHVGCGVGYYTAIIAEVVLPAPSDGACGHVVAIEIDAELAERARENLAGYVGVEVHQGDGATFDPGECDVIFVNAGATRPQPLWLDRLSAKGRLMVPLTVTQSGVPEGGGMLKVWRQGAGYGASFISMVYIFPCLGSRDEDHNRRLQKAFARSNSETVRSLRRDSHTENQTCWLHGADFCISTAAPPDRLKTT